MGSRSIFSGTFERGEGKNPGDEAYFVLKGTLTENISDANKKVTSHASRRDLECHVGPSATVAVAPLFDSLGRECCSATARRCLSLLPARAERDSGAPAFSCASLPAP